MFIASRLAICADGSSGSDWICQAHSEKEFLELCLINESVYFDSPGCASFTLNYFA